ncbi:MULTISPECIES: hypothetical protein [Streptomyces]|uniref:Uncharacterized protein n=1 Tax=Streptomyces ramulosus TaxID=47762 RepID=A0ABW1FMQ9_9ACTN
MKIPPRITRRINQDFPQEERATILQLLEEVIESAGRGIPILEERVAAAILLHSRGNFERFAQATDLAQHDWRDLLMAVDGMAHEGWEQHIDREFGAP